MSVQAVTPRRGRPRKFATRSREVVAHAAAAFAESGFAGATMHDLAARLGVTRPALYHYAPGKEALFKQCVAAAGTALDKAIVDALDQKDGKSQVTAFFLAYFDICGGDLGRCFALTDLRELDEAGRRDLGCARQRLAQAVASMIRCGVEGGDVGPCDPTLASALLFSSFNGAAQLQCETRDDRSARAKAILAIFFAGLEPRNAEPWSVHTSLRRSTPH